MEKATKQPVRAVPEGFHTVTPYLVVENAQGLIEFIEKAFDGNVTFVTKRDDGKITHATVTIGDSTVMVADMMEDMDKTQTAMLYLYVDDADAMFKKAVQAKGKAVQEPRTEFYGDRAGAVSDQWGNVWWIGTHVEDVEPEELERRAKREMKERKERSDGVHA